MKQPTGSSAWCRIAVGATTGMNLLPGGEFKMGNDRDYGFLADGEGPVHSVRLQPFWMDACAVTNEQFSDFVAATGYKTQAERFGCTPHFWTRMSVLS